MSIHVHADPAMDAPQEIDWNKLEPFAPDDPRYVFNMEALELYAARVLEQKANGVEMLTLVRVSWC